MNKGKNFNRYAADEVIVRQGDTEKVMYKLLYGKVITYLNYGQPGEHVVGVLSEGSYFGELSVLCGHPQPYTVVAYEDAMVMQVAECNLNDFIYKNIGNVKDIMQNLGNALLQAKANLELLLTDLDSYGQVRPETIERASLLLRQHAMQGMTDGTKLNTRA